VLGEVAHLHSTDLPLMRKLVHLPLGRAPQAGQVAVLRRDALIGWIRQQAGMGPDSVEVQGASQSRVLRAARQVQGEEVAQAALDALRSVMLARGLAGEAHVRALPRDLEVPPGALRLQVRPLDATSLRRRMVAWVDVWSQDMFVRAVPVSLEFSFSESVPGRSAEQPLLLRDELPEPGSQEGQAHEPAAVLRGEWATLRSVTGPVTLESRVEVLQDGRVGQKVRVRPSAGAAAMVLARVVGRGQLELAP
jgi:flagellar basal body P-ring formation protein FlgA